MAKECTYMHMYVYTFLHVHIHTYFNMYTWGLPWWHSG